MPLSARGGNIDGETLLNTSASLRGDLLVHCGSKPLRLYGWVRKRVNGVLFRLASLLVLTVVVGTELREMLRIELCDSCGRVGRVERVQDRERSAWLCNRCLRRLKKRGRVRLRSGAVIRSEYTLYFPVSPRMAPTILRRGLVPFETCGAAILLWGSPEEAVKFFERVEGGARPCVVLEVRLLSDLNCVRRENYVGGMRVGRPSTRISPTGSAAHS